MMSLEENIAQMFILGFEGTQLHPSTRKLQDFIRQGLGGVIFFEKNIAGYEQIAGLIDELQALVPGSLPLFTSIDQEGGKVQRTCAIPEHVEYLSPAELSATGKPKNAVLQAQLISAELLRMGINMNFAPVLDVNTNPQNPIIGIRAFGNTPAEVSAYAEGVYGTFQKNKIIPVGKHFPGHGDTHQDSHETLPHVDLPMEELERLHIAPFAQAIARGLEAVMVSHVHYRAFERAGGGSLSEELPASLSKAIVQDYLKGRLGFKGLIISDDMVMKAISARLTPIDSFIAAINAGIDLIIYKDSENLPENLFEQLAGAVNDGRVAPARVQESAEKILFFKKRYGILEKQAARPSFDPIAAQKEIDRIRPT